MFVQPFVHAYNKENIKVLLRLLFVRGMHQWPVGFPHKEAVARKIFPFDDVMMVSDILMVDDALVECELPSNL